MIRQYHAPRYTPGTAHHEGTIPVGRILYLQAGRGQNGYPTCRDPWIILAWKPREYAQPGQPNTFMAGGHLALVRSLRTGRECYVSDHLLRQADDEGREKQPATRIQEQTR